MSDVSAALEKRIARLEDIEAIRQLKARYLRASDLKKVDDLRDCFLPGAVRIAYQGLPTFTDREAFVASFEETSCGGGVYDLHHAGNSEIILVGEDVAHGRWTLDYRSIRLETSSVTRFAVEFTDVYRRAEGRWWIAESETWITSFLTEEIAEDGFARYLAWGSVPAGAA